MSRTFSLFSRLRGRAYDVPGPDVRGFYAEHVRGIGPAQANAHLVSCVGTYLIQLLEGDELVDVRCGANLVTTAGKALFAQRVSNSVANPAVYIGIGTGATPPSIGDVALSSEVGVRQTASATIAGATSSLSVTIPAGVGTGVITEAGRFDSLSGGILVARLVFAEINKTSLRALPVIHDLTFS